MTGRNAARNDSEWSGAHGKSIVHNVGSPITAPGNNAAAIAVIGFLMIVTVDTLDQTMGFESAGYPSWL
jgi:hypothetical protein